MIKYGIQIGKVHSDPTEMIEAIKNAGFEAVIVNFSGKFDNDKMIDIIRKVGLDIDQQLLHHKH